ncbi:MAG: glycosyltransferase [Leptospiraceae bacterium]|nr:glycosyltransferase [Leptospiraceae bacterium]
MRVIYFSDTFLPKIDGVSISIKNFSERLSQKGYEFIICCPEYGEGDFYRMNDKIHIERFMSAYLPSYPDIKVVLPSPTRVAKIIQDFQPHLCHIHTPGLIGQYAISGAERFGLPAIGTYHTLISEQDTYISLYRILKLDKLFMKINKFDKTLTLKNLLKFQKFDNFNIQKKIILKLCNYFYDRCDLIISPSHLLKQQLLEFGIKKPIAVVSNGMDLSRFRGKPKTCSKEYKLLHVGRISYEKNCDVVINAFAEIQKVLPNATLTIIGDGPALASLKLQVSQLKLEEKVIFKGFIPNTELPEIYPQYDLFMTASTMETQGLVILEAIACGLPAVGVNAYAIPELIQDGVNGYNAKPFQPKEMAELALKILQDEELYKSFSKKSLEIASEHEISKCVDKMDEVYQSTREFQGKKKKPTLLNLFLT